MKTISFFCTVALASLAVSFPAKASLGGDLASVQADRILLKGTLKSTAKDNYSVQEIKAGNGVIVREYTSPAGNVFGVAWEGPTHPDLRQLLGPYFNTFVSAVPANRTYRLVGGPFRIEKDGLVVEMGGHMRWYVGRAYVPRMIPSGVRQKEIR